MQKPISRLAFCYVLFAVSAAAQTVTGSGTANTVPLFTGTSTIGNSNITQSNGNVGIGTAAPGYALEIGSNSELRVDGPTSPTGTAFSIGGHGSFNIDAPGILGGRFTLTDSGSVGIGAPSPSGIFQISEPSPNTGNWINFYNNVGAGGGTPPSSVNSGLLFGWNPSDGLGESQILYGTGVGAPRLDFGRWSGTTKAIDMSLNGGNVGVGTTSPGAKLEVNGGIKLTSGSGGSITFADGTVQTTAANGVGGTCGGDYAESVDVSGSRTSYEPGDVLVISADAASDVARSTEPYSSLVAGIYSTKPGVVGRRQTIDPRTSKTEIPMAMVGIVPTKVSAENGPIKRGDLLVTSSTAGYAMKGTDRSLMLGAVIGKALGNLDSGAGVIEVLVTLQ
jgi:hypothetical protein